MNKRAMAASCGWLGFGAGLLIMGCSGASAVVGGNETGGVGGQGGATPANQPSVKRISTPITSKPGRCLPFELPLNGDGTASCKIFAATPKQADACSCDGTSRAAASNEAQDTVRALAKDTLLCDQPGAPACEDFCVCEDLPAAHADLSACLSNEDAMMDGWCYVSPDLGIGVLDAPCELGPQAKIRFLGAAQFSEKEEGFMVCSQTSSPKAKAEPLGSVCVPSDERSPTFSGFIADEVVIDGGSSACASGICVVQRFQGRVSCPFGSPAGAGECLVPDSNERVSVKVAAQLISRPPSLAATCSCRCAGPGDGPFCGCGAGMDCVPLVADLGFPGDHDAGSYCLPKGATEALEDWETCSAAPERCGDRLY
jgi:hypothetical protein